MRGCYDLLSAMALPSVDKVSDDDSPPQGHGSKGKDGESKVATPKKSMKKKEPKEPKPNTTPKKAVGMKKPAASSGSKAASPKKRPAAEEKKKIYKYFYKDTKIFGFKVDKKQVMLVRALKLLIEQKIARSSRRTA